MPAQVCTAVWEKHTLEAAEKELTLRVQGDEISVKNNVGDIKQTTCVCG